jgi:hypothetical protein
MLEGFDSKEKKVSAKKGPISAARLERVFKNVEFFDERPFSGNIPVSSILQINPRDFVIQYWLGQRSGNSGHKRLFTDVGTLVHKIIQESLWELGVIECPDCSDFEENKVYDPELRLSGYVDGVISPERLEYFDKNGITDGIPAWTTRLHLEIKTCSQEKFQYLKDESLIHEEYKASATCYQKLMKLPMTCFYFVSRDSMKGKTLFYEGEDKYWEMAVNKCNTINKHIRNHTLPAPNLGEQPGPLDDPKILESWINEQKERQPFRKFHDN